MLSALRYVSVSSGESCLYFYLFFIYLFISRRNVWFLFLRVLSFREQGDEVERASGQRVVLVRKRIRREGEETLCVWRIWQVVGEISLYVFRIKKVEEILFSSIFLFLLFFTLFYGTYVLRIYVYSYM